MSSPFPYDRIPNKEYFFGRTAEMDILNRHAKESTNLVLYSKRRMGKTSLITRFLEDQDKCLGIYIDIFDITSKEDFAIQLLQGLSNSQKGEMKTVLKWFQSLFKRVRVEPTIDPISLELSFKPIVATLSFEQMMEDWFQSIESISKKQKIIIAIDEFQQICEIRDVKLDALLRKRIQKRGNVSFIFSGSKRHLLNSMFEYKAPLFEMATPFHLEPLKLEDVHAYAAKHLDIPLDVTTYIYDQSEGETRLMQNIFHLLYLQKENEINQDSVNKIITEIVNSRQASYRLIFDQLNLSQKTALKIIGKNRGSIYSSETLEAYRIKKNTLQGALNSLFKKEIIDKDQNTWFIPDRTLELWVQRL